MRFASLLLLVACSSSTTATEPKRPSPGVAPVIAHATHSCADAALGLESSTKGVRSPDQVVFETLVKRCESDSWPVTAIDCFAKMIEGDLGKCSRPLDERTREAMFAVLAGSELDGAGILIARARLDQLSVGIPACDQFVTAVSAVLTCEGMPVDTRVQLGNETASFWSLPTDRLGEDDLRRMSEVCGESLATLSQQAAGVGCMP